MILRALAHFIAAVFFWWHYEGASLRPFGADGAGDDVVRCDGGGKA